MSSYRGNIMWMGILASLLIHLMVLFVISVHPLEINQKNNKKKTASEISVKFEKTTSEKPLLPEPVTENENPTGNPNFKYTEAKDNKANGELDQTSIEKLEKEGLIPELVLDYESFDRYIKICKHYGYCLCAYAQDKYICTVDLSTWKLSDIPPNADFLNAFSTRGRIVDFEDSYGLKEKVKARFNITKDEISFYFLIPKSVENMFINRELNAISRLGIAPEDVREVKGRYLSNFDIKLEYIALNDGTKLMVD